MIIHVSNRRNGLLMRYWNTYDAKSEIITSNQSTSQRRTRGSAAYSSSLHFRYICTVKEDQENMQIQTYRYKGKYLLLKCMTFHTFISYILLGNLINYLLLIACRSRSHSRSLILQSDIVEARLITQCSLPCCNWSIIIWLSSLRLEEEDRSVAA